MKKNGKELGHYYMFWDEFIEDGSTACTNMTVANGWEIEELLKLKILKLVGNKLLWNINGDLRRYSDIESMAKEGILFWVDGELYTNDEDYMCEVDYPEY